jgi:protein phosphatase
LGGEGLGGVGGGAGAAVGVFVLVAGEFSVDFDTLGGLDDVDGDVQRPEVLRLAVQKVSQLFYSEGARSLETRGMGSTLVMVWLHKQLATLAHVGDSRIYLWRNGRLKPLTIDHSVGNALLQLNQVTKEDIEKNARLRNLSRCMGMARDVEPEISQLVLKENDYLLLCSDGLTNMVSEDWISAVIGRELDLDWTCEMLVEAGNHAGGIDNISVILLRWGNVE